MAEKLEEIEEKLEKGRSEAAAQLGIDDKSVKLTEVDAEGGYAFRSFNRYEMAIKKIYEILNEIGLDSTTSDYSGSYYTPLDEID